MNRILILISLLFCAPVFAGDHVAPRDKLYWASATAIVMDSYSTWRALEEREDVQEIGYVMREMYGPRPSGKQILEATIFQLGILEWSRTWKPHTRKAFQWTITITKELAFINNMSIALD